MSERSTAESSGPFWKVYPLREVGKPLRFSLVVRVAPNVLRKCRIPAEYATPSQRKQFAKGAARAERELFEKEQNEQAERARRVSAGRGPTFHDFATLWTSGELRKLYPAHIKTKKSADDDAQILKVLKPAIGNVPLREFKVEDAERALAKLPKHLAPATVKKYGLFMHRVLSLAVYPGKVIAANPLPRGFLPAKPTPKAKTFLYPSEDTQLMACREVPLARRVLYGFLAREGVRLGEALALKWSDLDLARGTISLDTNKTNDPRTWVMGDDVKRALAAWRKLNSKAALVFRVETKEGEPLHVDSLATAFREWDLRKAKVDRAALFERTENRIPIRVHDLRASFVTLALALGKTETWVVDRTGHRSSQMVATYRRQARTASELGLGWFAPLDGAIPELRSDGASKGNVGGGNGTVSGSVSGSAKQPKRAPKRGGQKAEKSNGIDVVPKEGVEPSRGVTSADFESAASASSATSASAINSDGVGPSGLTEAHLISWFARERSCYDRAPMKLGALSLVIALAAALVPLGCGDPSPCAPLSPHDAGGCGQSYGVDYDPSTQTGCVFVDGSGSADTCRALCGQPATCDLITFTSVDCNVPCGE